MKNKNIKNDLIAVFYETLKLNKSAIGGNQFDNTILELFKGIKGFSFVSNEEWKKYYQPYRENSLKHNYDFSNIKLPKTIQDNFLIVDKPNGSQQTPDLLIIYDKKGICLEIKSSKDDKITWNSGLPKKDFIYIFVSYKQGKTTCFLGQDIISDKETQKLKSIQEKIKKLVEENKIENSEWFLYPRPMFQNNGKYFLDDKIRKEREKRAINFIKRMTK